MDSQRIKENFALVGEHGETVAKYFYEDLFERAPELRAMFTGDITEQQQKLLSALSQIVASVDDPDALVPYLQRLGAYHGGRGVSAEHYPIVGASLIATLRHFSGDAWTAEIEADWAAAYGVVTEVMAGASALGAFRGLQADSLLLLLSLAVCKCMRGLRVCDCVRRFSGHAAPEGQLRAGGPAR